MNDGPCVGIGVLVVIVVAAADDDDVNGTVEVEATVEEGGEEEEKNDGIAGNSYMFCISCICLRFLIACRFRLRTSILDPDMGRSSSSVDCTFRGSFRFWVGNDPEIQ